MSSPILVKAKNETILTSTQGTEPNLYLTFSGNFTNQTEENLKAFQTMIYNCLLIDFGLLIQSPILLYQGSVKAVVDTTGSLSSYLSLIDALNSTNFTLATDVVLQSAIVDGKVFSFISPSNDSQISYSQDIQSTAQANEENNAVFTISILYKVNLSDC